MVNDFFFLNMGIVVKLGEADKIRFYARNVIKRVKSSWSAFGCLSKRESIRVEQAGWM